MVATEPDRSASYLESFRKLAPLIAEHRGAFDRERRLPDEVFEALADAGLFRLWLPTSLGGAELSPLEFMRVVEAAAALDGSVGWLVGNGGGLVPARGESPPARTPRPSPEPATPFRCAPPAGRASGTDSWR